MTPSFGLQKAIKGSAAYQDGRTGERTGLWEKSQDFYFGFIKFEMPQVGTFLGIQEMSGLAINVPEKKCSVTFHGKT